LLRGKVYLDLRKSSESFLAGKSKRIQKYEKKRLADCAIRDFKDAKTILLINKEEEDTKVSQRRRQQREVLGGGNAYNTMSFHDQLMEVESLIALCQTKMNMH